MLLGDAVLCKSTLYVLPHQTDTLYVFKYIHRLNDKLIQNEIL